MWPQSGIIKMLRGDDSKNKGDKKMKIESARKYFRKNGVIYGLSIKDNTPVYLIEFDNWKIALDWYYEE